MQPIIRKNPATAPFFDFSSKLDQFTSDQAEVGITTNAKPLDL